LSGDGAAFRTKYAIDPDKKILGLFCGSRTSEVRGLAPIMIEVAKKLQETHPELVCVVPTLPKWQAELEKLCADAGVSAIISSDSSEKWDAFSAPDAALAVSGTVALEVALAGVPHAILYKMNSLTWEIVRRVVKTKFAHLGNILLGNLVYPEFIQDDAEAGKIVPVMERLLSSEAERRIQRESSKKIRLLLEPNQNEKAADRAAAFIKTISG
jgi:lipid-A-disaccharide synthase